MTRSLLYLEGVPDGGSSIAAMIGVFGPVAGTAFRNAARRADADALVLSSTSEWREALTSFSPTCVFVDCDRWDLAATTSWMREQPHLFSTQVIAVVSELRDGSFVESYRGGADDVVVRTNMGGITRRIANLQGFDPSRRPPVDRGLVLVSHPNDDQRRRLGRVLRQAGFDVRFGSDSGEVSLALKSEHPPELVVVSNELMPVAEIARARRAANACRAPFVVVATSSSTRIVLDPRVESVATISESAPQDHLLFLANDLLRGQSKRTRKSIRYLFDTICSFRAEGEFTPEYGLTYNLSESGIYVRTLDPPTRGTSLWLELRPPGTTRTVHLRGTLVRVARPGRHAQSAPPGFGLRIEEGASPSRDLEDYRNAYRTLAQVPHQLALSWLP